MASNRSNSTVISEYWIGKHEELAGVAWLEILFHGLPRETEENKENFQLV